MGSTGSWPRNLLLGLSSHLATDLSYAHPVSTRHIQRHNLQTAAAIPHVLRPTYALTSAFFYPTNLVTVFRLTSKRLSFCLLEDRLRSKGQEKQ
jgi:hypothetical protein